ncbi:MAG: response regulator [Planctomycetaceae bacterium]|nr:response regulator [Planctomycetaceae bacterium]
MKSQHEAVTFLMADDDPDDRLLTQKALKEYRLMNGMKFVEDGVELMDYLYHRGKFADPATSPRPGVILLDLNMPKKDGRQALEEIKADPHLHSIPVVVLTTSKAEEDILRSYDLGVNAYITKPVTFQELVEVMRVVALFWFEIVKLPNGQEGNSHG